MLARVRPEAWTPPRPYVTVPLPTSELATALLIAGIDPADPAAPLCWADQTYIGCIVEPDGAGGWRPAAHCPDVPVRARHILTAAALIAGAIGIGLTLHLAPQQVLAVRWSAAADPSCYLTATQAALCGQQGASCAP